MRVLTLVVINLAIIVNAQDTSCAGSWSACTAACETADDRTWTEVTAQHGSGAACPVAVDCEAGEDGCETVVSEWDSGLITNVDGHAFTLYLLDYQEAGIFAADDDSAARYADLCEAAGLRPVTTGRPDWGAPRGFCAQFDCMTLPATYPSGDRYFPPGSWVRAATALPSSNFATARAVASDGQRIDLGSYQNLGWDDFVTHGEGTAVPRSYDDDASYPWQNWDIRLRPVCGVEHVACAGSWSACTAACETADDRTWIEATAQQGGGAACPVAVACEAGDGECAATGSLGGYMYQGCFADPTQIPRDMSGQPVDALNIPLDEYGNRRVDDPSTALADCAHICTGYAFMGLQWALECFCDNSYGGHGAAIGCGAQGGNCGSGITSFAENPCREMNAVFSVTNEPGVVTISDFDWYQGGYDREYNSDVDACIAFMLADVERRAATFVHSNAGSDAGTCYAFRTGFDCASGGTAIGRTSYIHCGRADAACRHCAIEETAEPSAEPTSDPEQCTAPDLVLDYEGDRRNTIHAQFGAQQVITTELYGRQMVISEPLRACDSITVDMTGKIALIQRGDCYFTTKVWNAEQRGAEAVVIYNADGLSLVSSMTAGTDDPVTILSILIEESFGNLLNAAVAADPNVFVSVYCDPSHQELMEPVMELATQPTAGNGTSDCNPECQFEWEEALAVSEVICSTGYHVDCRLCSFCTNSSQPTWTVEEGPCELFGPGNNTCVGRPYGYLPNERCEITVHGDGQLGLCPVWSIDWTFDLPCFSRGSEIPSAENGSAVLNQTCPNSGVCPVGFVLYDGDAVVWQSDSAIQGSIDPQWQGLIEGTAPPSTDGLGGGWALCFEYRDSDSNPWSTGTGSSSTGTSGEYIDGLKDMLVVGGVVVGLAIAAAVLLSMACICCCVCRACQKHRASVDVTAAPTSSHGDVAVQLQHLVNMRNSGHLNDGEFKAAKAQTLGKTLPSTTLPSVPQGP